MKARRTITQACVLALGLAGATHEAMAQQPGFLNVDTDYKERKPQIKVSIDRARAARSVLESRGASVEYHEHRVGHKVSAQGMKEITRWIGQILA